jgi:hypothetical protein
MRSAPAFATLLAVLMITCASGARSQEPSASARSQSPPAAAPATSQPASQPGSHPAATSRAASQPAAAGATGVKTVKPFPGVTAIIDADDPSRSRIELKAYTCLDAGWLEQVACMPGTREHESLMVVDAKPSQVHAALLMAGFEPGKPGRWTYENQKFGAIDPTGDKVAIVVRYVDKEGKTIEHDVGKWIREPASKDKAAKPFPREPWVFGGSVLARNTPDMGPGEHYVADMTGSLIGLVTFGDETIGFSRVLSDQETVQEPEWEANTEALPEVATPVTLIIQKWKDDPEDGTADERR